MKKRFFIPLAASVAVFATGSLHAEEKNASSLAQAASKDFETCLDASLKPMGYYNMISAHTLQRGSQASDALSINTLTASAQRDESSPVGNFYTRIELQKTANDVVLKAETSQRFYEGMTTPTPVTLGRAEDSIGAAQRACMTPPPDQTRKECLSKNMHAINVAAPDEFAVSVNSPMEGLDDYRVTPAANMERPYTLNYTRSGIVVDWVVAAMKFNLTGIQGSPATMINAAKARFPLHVDAALNELIICAMDKAAPFFLASTGSETTGTAGQKPMRLEFTFKPKENSLLSEKNQDRIVPHHSRPHRIRRMPTAVAVAPKRD